MLDDLMARRAAAIAGAWFDRILDEYPPETARFLREQSDPFANPVGSALREETAAIVDALVRRSEGEAVERSLDRVIRVRAVQELSAGQAVGFLFHLKDLIRDELADVEMTPADFAELRDLDVRIDRIVLMAFDVFATCREQVYSIRIEEIRNRSLKMMERLNEWRSRRDGATASDAPELT